MESYVGQIMLWPMSWAPQDWAICDGSLLPLNQYMALYSLIGVAYGGNGTTTFGLPDLRGKVPLGVSATHPIGQKGGLEAYTGTVNVTASLPITVANLPAHSHTATFTGATGASASVAIPVDNDSNATDSVATKTMVLGKGVSGTQAVKTYSTGASNDTLKPFDVALPTAGGTVTVADTGASQPLALKAPLDLNVPTMPPFVTLNFIICLNGLYPPRP